MIPAGLVSLPTVLSLKCLVATLCLKVVDLAANIVSVVACLRVDLPMVEYTHDLDKHEAQPLEITRYIQVVACGLLIISVISLSLSIVIVAFNYSFFCSKKHSEVGHP